MTKIKYDFSGYVTKNDLRCSDGRIIRKDAFKHQDGVKVPLVWQHLKKEPSNILGHVYLEHRDDGVYGYGVFNDTESGIQGKALVKHGDIEALSIHANRLKQEVSDVLHGMIREVSLVLTGANPGALIDYIKHEDNEPVEATIYTGEFIHTDEGEVEVKEKEAEKKEVKENQNDSEIEHADKTVGDIYNEMTEEQKNVVAVLVANAIEDEEITQEDDEGGDDSMKHNVFEGNKENTKKAVKGLTLEDSKRIMENARKIGSMREAVLIHMEENEIAHMEDIIPVDAMEHAGTYGIDNINYLFPDARNIRNTPDWVKRRTEWVMRVIGGCSKSPFSRIKSMSADITADEARAKGYVTGAEKTEEVFALAKRETTPTTIYKKQKLDRDDIIDITDMDVVAWLKAEMRMMLDEEIGRAILVGDGRAVDHADKIDEAKIRPIYNDADFYTHKVTLGSDATTLDIIEEIMKSRKNYKGSGTPTFYCNTDILTDMLLVKDTTGRRIYETVESLKAVLRVKDIVEVEVMDGVTRVDGDDTNDLLGVIVNLADYTIGADKGGKISMFDDFDIDYNQHKYLIEGRMSGCLTRPKSAMTIEKTQAVG